MAPHNLDSVIQKMTLNVQNILQNCLKEMGDLHTSKKFSARSTDFFRDMTHVIDYFIVQLRLSPEEEEHQQAYYRDLEFKIDKLKENFSVLSRILEQRRGIREHIEERMNAQIKRNFELVEEIKKKCSKKIGEISLKYEKMQINGFKQSMKKQNDLNQILKVTENRLQNVLIKNEHVESGIYSKRVRITSQYLTLINRYDSEIGEKQKIISNLKAEFELLSKQRLELEDAIDEQTKILNLCIDTIHAEKTKMRNSSRQLNATRIIQRWWRLIISERKITSHKDRKKKKKKKKKRKRKKKREKMSL